MTGGTTNAHMKLFPKHEGINARSLNGSHGHCDHVSLYHKKTGEKPGHVTLGDHWNSDGHPINSPIDKKVDDTKLGLVCTCSERKS